MIKFIHLFAFAATAATTLAASPAFYGFDRDTVGRDFSSVRDINAHGMVAISGAANAIWNPDVGYVHEVVLGNDIRRVSWSGDTVLINRSGTRSGLWQYGSGYQDLPLAQIKANGMTADGGIIVGNDVQNDRAFRWSKDFGYQELEGLAGGNGIGQAHDITPDGKTTVGGAWNGDGFNAVMYDQNGHISDLGVLDGYFSNIAYGVSDNGRYITGVSRNGLNAAAFRWDRETGETLNIGEGLGHATTGIDGFLAYDVSNDGTVVGHYGGEDFFPEGDDEHAVIYNDKHGWRTVEQMLLDDFDIVISDDWDLEYVYSISSDGTMIGGSARYITGASAAWVAIIPAPSSLSVLPVILLSITNRRRYRRM